MKTLKAMLVTLSILVLSGAVVEGAERPRQGGTLTVAIGKDLILMNPLVGTKSTDQSIRELMYEELLGLDLKGRIQPHLAESWSISEDGRVYTFKLRKGVKFHNGQEMTAEDAKFAADWTLNPKNGASGYPLLTSVDRVEAVDRYSLRIFLKNPNAAFLSFFTDIKPFSVVPKGSLPEGMEKMTSFPPGTGPFQFVEWQPRQRIVLQRYDGYWGEKAPLDKVVLRPVKEATVRFNALVAGDVDMTERVPYEWVKEIREGRTKGLQIAKATLAGLNALIFNVANPPFNNKKLRFAVAHAIDRGELLRAAFEGFGEANDQKYPKGHNWYFEGLPWPAHNLEKARVLLKEAGYQGQAIPIITSPEAMDQTMAVTLQAQLKRIGMPLTIETLEVGAYNTRQLKGEFAFRFRGGDFYPDPWMTYGRDLLCEEDLKKRVSNNSGFCDRETEALLKKAEIEVDPAKRKELFRKVLWRVAEEVPEIFIGYVPRFFAYRDNVKGFSTDDAGRFRWTGGGLATTWLDKR